MHHLVFIIYTSMNQKFCKKIFHHSFKENLSKYIVLKGVQILTTVLINKNTVE